MDINFDVLLTFSISIPLSGNFEPPGAKLVASYVAEHDRETDPRWVAIKAAELKLQAAGPTGAVVRFSARSRTVTCLNIDW